MSSHLKECVDIDALNYILQNFDDVVKQINFKNENFGKTFSSKEEYIKSLKTILFNYAGNLDKDGVASVFYKYSGNCKTFGRQFAVGPSLQSLPTIIRNTISRKFYVDLDVVNMHPTILQWYCKTHNIVCTHLSEYVSRREELMAEIVEAGRQNGLMVSREQIKMIILKIINGGGISPLKEETAPDFIVDFYNEMAVARTAICNLNPELVGIAKKNNISGSVTNYMMCDYENKVLMCMKDALESNGQEVGVLMFDGLMIPKKGDTDITKDTTIVDKIIENVKRDIGIDIKLKFKPMDDVIDCKTDVKLPPMTTFVENHKVEEIYKLDQSTDECITIEDIDETERWCRDIVFKDHFRSTGIKLRLGGGKTSACIRYIDRANPYKILLLSPRISFAESITEEYNSKLTTEKFVCYTKQTKKQFLRTHNRVCCSLESLHYLDNWKPDLIIIDECQAMLTQHTCMTTNGIHLDTNITLFKQMILDKDTKLIWADAFLGQKTMNFIKNLNIPTHIYNYKCKMEPREAIEIVPTKKKDMDCLLSILYESLDKGEKNYVYVSALARLKIWLPLLRKKYPDKKFMVYSGDDKSSLKNVREDWSTCDAVLVTSTITVGINYDIPDYFHNIFIYATRASGNRMTDIFQSHYRVRHIINNRLYFFIDEKNIGYKETNRFQINQDFKWREDAFLEKTSHFIKCDPYIQELVIDNDYESNMSARYIRPMFNYFLRECNYTVIDPREIDDIELDFEHDDDCKDTDFSDIAFLDVFQYTMLMNKQRNSQQLTDIERLQLDKYMFTTCFIMPEPRMIDDKEGEPRRYDFDSFASREHIDELWKLWVNFGRTKIRQFRKEKKIHEGVCTIDSLFNDLAQKCKIGGMQSKKFLQLEFIVKMCNDLGVKNSCDVDTIIPNKVLKGVHDRIKDDNDRIRKTFDLQDRTADKSCLTFDGMVQLMNSILKKNGFTKIVKGKRRRVRIEGKQLDESDYQLQSNIPKDKLSVILKALDENMTVKSDYTEEDRDRPKLRKWNGPPIIKDSNRYI